ncbi:MAG: hypothetical protein PUC68_01830 [Firmicutes bacterium]|nr:hypothetical protein [Bacillota bacterium]
MDYAYIDGSYDKESLMYGYGGFLVHDDKEYLLQGAGFDELGMHNVSGEIEGAMAVVRRCRELGIDKIRIYYDYKGIELWVSGEWKAKKEGTIAYRDFMRNSGVNIEFTKVKGHSKVEGNEKADQLAKEAVQNAIMQINRQRQ